ncbi:MAG: hypothetical protein ACI9QL_001410, partial [Candidatus Omnitrophota bacterium]
MRFVIMAAVAPPGQSERSYRFLGAVVP